MVLLLVGAIAASSYALTATTSPTTLGGASMAAARSRAAPLAMLDVDVDKVFRRAEFWEEETMPEEWESGLLAILPKKGDLSAPGNHRGIMLLEVAYKIVAIILCDRLEPVCENLDHESQCGFRSKRGTTDAIFQQRVFGDDALGSQFESTTLFCRERNRSCDCSDFLLKYLLQCKLAIR